jgi:hypothetical protein
MAPNRAIAQRPGGTSQVTVPLASIDRVSSIVPALVPITNTAMYLPFCVDSTVKVLPVALLIGVQVLGIDVLGELIAAVQVYHW